MRKQNLYIGLMSGTSLDGVDVAVVDVNPIANSSQINLVASHSLDLPQQIKSNLLTLSFEDNINIHMLGETGVLLARLFADAVNQTLNDNNIDAQDIVAIGSHGLTIRHQPVGNYPFSMQITDCNLLAQMTGIDVIGDFRNMDIAVGGQGAPLVPAFHQALFNHMPEGCVVLNLGGIANISVLTPNAPVIGYDTGPANTLMDTWCKIHTQQNYDKGGLWAASGNVNDVLLTSMLADNYFQLPLPKSTGKEHFNLDWLNLHLTNYQLEAENNTSLPALSNQDIQRTLLQLTAESIYQQIKQFSHTQTLLVCGGGSHNALLMSELGRLLPEHDVKSTNKVGVDGDAMEAMAFAWLAYCRVNLISANSPSVTGANRNVVMGSWYSAVNNKVINK